MEAVSKAQIVVVRSGLPFALMSRKNAPGEEKHGQLEMLGGGVIANESPIDALVREFGEEERTGTLARIARSRRPRFETRMVVDAPHHLFELAIAERDYLVLEADPKESLGFELVPTADLTSGRIEAALTPRTREILRVFGPTRASINDPRPVE